MAVAGEDAAPAAIGLHRVQCALPACQRASLLRAVGLVKAL